ncbi:MAG: hypothetical protein ACOYXT_03595 [Bacteroidota bacterium]
MNIPSCGFCKFDHERSHYPHDRFGGDVLACREEDNRFGSFIDPRDNSKYVTVNINGTEWMMEDLHYGALTYTYQQALNACPDGWSLPSAGDWDNVSLHFGGYLKYSSLEGDPSKSYDAMVNKTGFNITPGARYWSDTPAWVESPQIRSYATYIDNIDHVVKLSSAIITEKHRCRCVKHNRPVTNDVLKFKINGKPFQLDFYRIDSELHAHQGRLAVIVHNTLSNGLQIDRCLFTVEVPQAFVTPQSPTAVTNATLNHQSLDVIWNENVFYNSQGPVYFSLTVTKYDGDIMEDTFTGQTYDLIQLTEGEFQFAIKKE